MGMQAGATRLALGPTDPRVSAALASIEETGRQAIGDLQRLVGLLRDARDEEGARHDGRAVDAPQPDLTMLSALIEGSRAAGMPVSLRTEGDLSSVPDAPALAAYRIVQEALTNARKHGTGEYAEVVVAADQESVVVSVRNPVRDPVGAPAAVPSASGHGLLGMRERAGLHGGEVTAGPDGTGWFAVRAVVPLRGVVLR